MRGTVRWALNEEFVFVPAFANLTQLLATTLVKDMRARPSLAELAARLEAIASDARLAIGPETVADFVASVES